MLSGVDSDVARDLNAVFAPHPAWVTFWRVVSAVGQPATWQVLAVVTALVLVVRALRPPASHKRRQLTTALWTALTVPLASALSTLIKSFVGRDRPTVAVPLAHAGGSSFPSGHAMTSIVGVAVLVTVWTAIPRRVSVPVGALIVLLIGFSRLALGVHYLSDVLAGWLFGAVWVSLTRTLVVRVRARQGPASASPGRPRGRRCE